MKDKIIKKISQKFSFNSSVNWILFNMNLTRRQISAVIKLYYKTQSSVKVMRIMQKEFPGLKQHSKQYILRTVRRFEKTGSI